MFSVRNLLTMWKRDFRSYFYTPLAYVFIGFFLLLMGFMFVIFIQTYEQFTRSGMFGQGNQITIDRFFEAFYTNMQVMLMFMIPFFTMRLFTTEASQNTFALLMTSPVKYIEIVLAKFSGAVSIIVITLALTGIFPIFLYVFSGSASESAGPDSGIVFGTYLGLLLVSFTYAAIGVFWSSITQSQLIALVLTFFNVFCLWLLSIWSQSATGPLQSILKQLAINEHFSSFMKGSIESKSIVMMLSYIVFYLFLTNRSLESRAWRS